MSNNHLKKGLKEGDLTGHLRIIGNIREEVQSLNKPKGSMIAK